MRTIFTELEAAARANPQKPALIEGEAALSFGEFLGRVRGVAGAFHGLPPGPIALSIASPSNALVAFFAAAAVGRPAFVLDPHAPPERIAQALAQAEPAAHLTALPPPGELAELPEVSSEAEFYWGLTSGTTAAPKIFARTHRSWLATFETAESLFDFAPEDRVALPGSLSHSLFLFGAVHALCRGMPAILCAPFRPARVARELAAHRANVLYVVPAMLDSLMKSRETAWRKSLPLIFSSGAKLSDEMRAGVETALPGVDLVEGYGSSETSYVSYVSTRAPAPQGSVGRLFPGVEVDIRDAEGQRCAPGESGTVWVRSEMIFARYVGGPEAVATGGWVTAGDAGVLADGFLYLKGRANRIINIKGLKVHPEVIEHALLAHPDVAGAAVVGLDDEKRGQRLAAVVIPCGGKAARASLSAHCRTALGPRLTPQDFFAAEALPQTRSGKVAVDALRQALMRGDPAYEALE
ncbi:class I adenylate-forming enzyme family protein [Dichotomicrobium thermohalophilum]|uniref:Long-chain acyl-CoA synthetase n=1 Tax=Dichotomicrobium thermohalophilum TaxID=933063 RepID=A0A397QCA4_9HYPH|nr:AMP-binding protein [Dichotomicrobium thermohalophilum]RIA55881.1 long-chain acyl-CoA synthetase [Dichotomicrobium thermohalophilum]